MSGVRAHCWKNLRGACMGQMPELTDAKKAEIDKKIRADLAASDVELQELLDLVFGRDDQGVDSSFGLTLVTAGGVISGTAITHAAWAERLNEALTKAGAGSIAEVRRKIDAEVDGQFTELNKAREAESRPLPPRRFVHLKDVTLMGTNVRLQNTRVRLSSVNAWELGSWAEV
jgi:hypothetical protein